MKGKWHGKRWVNKQQLRRHVAIPGIVEDAAKRALTIVMKDPELQKQLRLFFNRKSVDRGTLDAVYKGGLTTLIREGLVAGKKGGKQFFITPAGMLALLELAKGT